MRGVTAVFLSDVHVTRRTTEADMDALAGKVAALKPDLILLGGDYADEAEHTVRLFRRLKGLSAPLGAYAVVGNNDREAFGDLGPLRRLMAESGFELLVNAARPIDLPGGRLIVAGLDEYRYGHPDPAGLYPSDPAPDAYRLLLSHYPHDVEPMPDLMLSGHTHGGQFNFLGLTPYAVGFERLLTPHRASRFIAGLHAFRGGQVLVSKGIGASRIPLRIGVRPEIEMIRFDSQKNA
ncbi:MAG: metallophosphoesterase [Clostridia bacterium]|nr:metallophosphoesterase [Clostridia bacterium]